MNEAVGYYERMAAEAQARIEAAGFTLAGLQVVFGDLDAQAMAEGLQPMVEDEDGERLLAAAPWWNVYRFASWMVEAYRSGFVQVH